MEQEERNVTIRNHWLHERSMLFEKYAFNMPTKPDRIDLQLEYTGYGWIDMHILVNGEEKVLINTSDVYESYVDTREWLEQIVSHIFDFTPNGVNIYDECYNYILYYEPILFQTDELLTPTPPELCGLFYIYDGYERKIVADAFCETKEFVRSFYQKILDFALSLRGNEEFVDDWCWDAYNAECAAMWEKNDPEIGNIFVNKVSSNLIEKFISDENSTIRFRPIKIQ